MGGHRTKSIRALARLIAAALSIAVVLWAPAALAAGADRIAVVHDDAPLPRPACASCAFFRAAAAVAPSRAFDGVVVTGHSGEGLFLGLPARALAEKIAALSPEPEWLVLDTCLGAQAELLLSLERAGVRPRMTFAVADYVPKRGLPYGDALLRAAVSADDLAALFASPRPGEVRVTRIPGSAWSSIGAAVEGARARAGMCELSSDLVSVMPNLAQVDLPGAEGPILVEISPEAFPERCFPAHERRAGGRAGAAALALSMLLASGIAVYASRRRRLGRR